VGTVAGIGVAVVSGFLAWPVIGAVTGAGVGDLVAGRRR
jgi:hypothetical protein